MANTFKNAATGSSTDIVPLYTCPGGTTAVVHAIYLSNIDDLKDLLQCLQTNKIND